VSPKTANSDPQGGWRERHRRLRRDIAPLCRLIGRHSEYQLKFVIQDGDDLPEVLELIETVGGVEPSRVLLMPEGRSAAEVAGRAAEVAALCVRHGFRYTPRLQLDLFGGGRGV
jgi:7-carboxy-7-deazaguanine synthase